MEMIFKLPFTLMLLPGTCVAGTVTTDSDRQTTVSTDQPFLYNCSDMCLDPPQTLSTIGCLPDVNDPSNDTRNTGTTCSNTTEAPLDSCDRLTGRCLYGCPSAYTGPSCNIRCRDYGVFNCEKCVYDEEKLTVFCAQCAVNFYRKSEGRCYECPRNCLTFNSSTNICNHDDGTCNIGCKDGYYGVTCQRRCTPSCIPRVCSPGDGCCSKNCLIETQCGCHCSDRCSSTCADKLCNPDCTCKLGCIPGRYEPTCDKSCSSNCVSLNNTEDICNDTNGHCYYGCVNDTTWTGTCGKPCSERCMNGTCDQFSGECTQGCVTPEWHGPDCSRECSRTCKEQQCLREDGTCLLECLRGKWGDHCENDCSMNCLNKTCDRYNETCTHGCTDGFFGRLCYRNCGVTCMHDVCDFTTGVCFRGCKGCYIGNFCIERCPDNTWIYVGIGCAICLVIVLPIIIVFGRVDTQ